MCDTACALGVAESIVRRIRDQYLELGEAGLVDGRPKPTVCCPWSKRAKNERLRDIAMLLEHLRRNEVAVYEDEVDVHLNPKIGLDWMVQAVGICPIGSLLRRSCPERRLGVTSGESGWSALNEPVAGEISNTNHGGVKGRESGHRIQDFRSELWNSLKLPIGGQAVRRHSPLYARMIPRIRYQVLASRRFGVAVRLRHTRCDPNLARFANR